MPQEKSESHPLEGVGVEQLIRILAVDGEYGAVIDEGGEVIGFGIIEDGTEPVEGEEDNALLALAALKQRRDERKS